MCVSLRNQGRAAGGGWLSHVRLGYNYRLSDINCALGIVQLSRIEEIKRKRKQVAKWYQENLAGDDRLIVPTEPAGCDTNWFVFVVRLADRFTRQNREKVLETMRDAGIQVSNYFTPVHLQAFMVERFGFKPGDFPVTEKIAERTIALPFYNNLSKDEVGIVCDELRLGYRQALNSLEFTLLQVALILRWNKPTLLRVTFTLPQVNRTNT